MRRIVQAARRLSIDEIPSSAGEPDMKQRLLAAAERLGRSPTVASFHASYAPRDDQSDVFGDFVDYLRDAATRPDNDPMPFGRIIQPPRTGKTIVAGYGIGSTQLTSVYIVPSKALVNQVATELRKMLPDVPVGIFFSETKDIVENGVNVTTYSILQKRWAAGKLPKAIRTAALVYADEAHVSMTDKRMWMLRNAFDPHALRIALTATPNYDEEERVLSRFFPELIHEITIDEALELDLLAPMRWWLAEVDIDATKVKVIAGDYSDEDLGELMSNAPFFRAGEVYRYAKGNRELPALVCCKSRRQAIAFTSYLRRHRPKRAPVPRLVLGTTKSRKRDQILADFKAGKIDTIINVGVLIQGANLPTCKLLIDIAPSASMVRSIQKYFRPMTKVDDTEARIYVIVPKNLPVYPVMPSEMFGRSYATYRTGELITSRNKRKRVKPPPHEWIPETPIERVTLKADLVFERRGEAPPLDPTDCAGIAKVLRTNLNFDPDNPCRYHHFRGLMFAHELFTGRGIELMRHLKMPLGFEGYAQLLRKVFPEGAANSFLRRYDAIGLNQSCYEDVKHLKTVSWRSLSLAQAVGYEQGWLALHGNDEPPDSIEDRLEIEYEGTLVRSLLSALIPIKQRIIRWVHGLDGEPELTYKEIGDKYNLSRERVRQLCAQGLAELRGALARHYELFEQYTLEKSQRKVRPAQEPMTAKQIEHTVYLRGEVRLDEQIERYGALPYYKLVREVLLLNRKPQEHVILNSYHWSLNQTVARLEDDEQG